MGPVCDFLVAGPAPKVFCLVSDRPIPSQAHALLGLGQIGSKLRLRRMSGNFLSCRMTLVLSFILEFLTLRQFEGVGFH